MLLRILSYNIHKGIGGVDNRYRPERIVATVEHYQPDVLLLQEATKGMKRCSFHDQVELLGEELGFKHRLYQANVKRKTGHYGNAILSHHPLKNPHRIDLTVPPKKKRGGLTCELHLKVGEHTRTVVLVNVHLGLAAYERALQILRLMESDFIHNRAGDTPILLGGDFNDIWENLCRKFLDAEGFVSALKKAKTFPAIYPARSLDRIFYRGAVTMETAFVGRTSIAREASDHLPVIADFRLK